MKLKIIGVMSMTIISVVAIMLVTGAYLAFVPVKVLTPNVQPYKVLTKNVRVGDTLIYEVDACKYHEASATVIRRFVDVDNTSYPLPPQLGNVVKGCQKSNIPIITPALHSGTWYLALDISYKVNAFRTENYHLVTEKFNIIP